MAKVRIAVNGAAGRMGQRLVSLASIDPELEVAAALESPQHPRFADDAGIVAGVGSLNLPFAKSLEGNVDVAVDFSVPTATEAIATVCYEHAIPLVVATTGLSDRQQSQLRRASEKIPLIWAPNMSRAVNLTMKLAEVAGTTLKDDSSGVDVEIVEQHHRYKEDAPSGTALRFGEIVAAVMGQTEHVHGRHGRPGKRPPSEIGYHALRVGDDPGQHRIVFGMLGERIELTVRASSRDCYALGALAAAKFVVKQSPGLYSMYDVLGL